MMFPQLIYAEDPISNQIACMASFVPTFDSTATDEAMELLYDEEPTLS